MNSEKPVVVIEHLTKRYGEFTALDDLSLTLSAGQILGLIGPNGAGKTTAIKILVGLARPTGGTARIGDADCVTDARRIKHLVGYMPDRFGSYDNMRVREYLDFFGAAFSIPRRQRIARIDDVMETTGTTYMRDKFVESLSHGMQQRVGVARTLLHDPQVLILDEPLTGLDAAAARQVKDLLIERVKKGNTIVLTTHILEMAERLAERISIIQKGKIIAQGSLDELRVLASSQPGASAGATLEDVFLGLTSNGA